MLQYLISQLTGSWEINAASSMLLGDSVNAPVTVWENTEQSFKEVCWEAAPATLGLIWS